MLLHQDNGLLSPVSKCDSSPTLLSDIRANDSQVPKSVMDNSSTTLSSGAHVHKSTQHETLPVSRCLQSGGDTTHGDSLLSVSGAEPGITTSRRPGLKDDALLGIAVLRSLLHHNRVASQVFKFHQQWQEHSPSKVDSSTAFHILEIPGLLPWTSECEAHVSPIIKNLVAPFMSTIGRDRFLSLNCAASGSSSCSTDHAFTVLDESPLHLINQAISLLSRLATLSAAIICAGAEGLTAFSTQGGSEHQEVQRIAVSSLRILYQIAAALLITPAAAEHERKIHPAPSSDPIKRPEAEALESMILAQGDALARILLQMERLTALALLTAQSSVLVTAATNNLWQTVFGALNTLDPGCCDLFLCNLAVLSAVPTLRTLLQQSQHDAAVITCVILLSFLESTPPETWRDNKFAPMLFQQVVEGAEKSSDARGKVIANGVRRILQSHTDGELQLPSSVCVASSSSQQPPSHRTQPRLPRGDPGVVVSPPFFSRLSSLLNRQGSPASKTSSNTSRKLPRTRRGISANLEPDGGGVAPKTKRRRSVVSPTHAISILTPPESAASKRTVTGVKAATVKLQELGTNRLMRLPVMIDLDAIGSPAGATSPAKPDVPSADANRPPSLPFHGLNAAASAAADYSGGKEPFCFEIVDSRVVGGYCAAVPQSSSTAESDAEDAPRQPWRSLKAVMALEVDFKLVSMESPATSAPLGTSSPCFPPDAATGSSSLANVRASGTVLMTGTITGTMASEITLPADKSASMVASLATLNSLSATNNTDFPQFSCPTSKHESPESGTGVRSRTPSVKGSRTNNSAQLRRVVSPCSAPHAECIGRGSRHVISQHGNSRRTLGSLHPGMDMWRGGLPHGRRASSHKPINRMGIAQELNGGSITPATARRSQHRITATIPICGSENLKRTLTPGRAMSNKTTRSVTARAFPEPSSEPSVSMVALTGRPAHPASAQPKSFILDSSRDDSEERQPVFESCPPEALTGLGAGSLPEPGSKRIRGMPSTMFLNRHSSTGARSSQDATEGASVSADEFNLETPRTARNQFENVASKTLHTGEGSNDSDPKASDVVAAPSPSHCQQSVTPDLAEPASPINQHQTPSDFQTIVGSLDSALPADRSSSGNQVGIEPAESWLNPPTSRVKASHISDNALSGVLKTPTASDEPPGEESLPRCGQPQVSPVIEAATSTSGNLTKILSDTQPTQTTPKVNVHPPAATAHGLTWRPTDVVTSGWIQRSPAPDLEQQAGAGEDSEGEGTAGDDEPDLLPKEHITTDDTGQRRHSSCENLCGNGVGLPLDPMTSILAVGLSPSPSMMQQRRRVSSGDPPLPPPASKGSQPGSGPAKSPASGQSKRNIAYASSRTSVVTNMTTVNRSSSPSRRGCMTVRPSDDDATSQSKASKKLVSANTTPGSETVTSSSSASPPAQPKLSLVQKQISMFSSSPSGGTRRFTAENLLQQGSNVDCHSPVHAERLVPICGNVGPSFVNLIVQCLCECCQGGGSGARSSAATRQASHATAPPSALEPLLHAFAEIHAEDPSFQALKAAKTKGGSWLVQYHLLHIVDRLGCFHQHALEKSDQLTSLHMCLGISADNLRSSVTKQALGVIRRLYSEDNSRHYRKILDCGVHHILPICVRKAADQTNLFLADAAAAAMTAICENASEIPGIACVRSIIATAKNTNTRCHLLRASRILAMRAGDKFAMITDVDKVASFAVKGLRDAAGDTRAEAKLLCHAILDCFAHANPTVVNRISTKMRPEDWQKLQSAASSSECINRNTRR